MPIDRDDDLYEVLQVSPYADREIVEAAYRRLALRHHPDRNGGSRESAEQMLRINRAYEILGDRARRAAYDREHAAGQRGQPTAPVTAERPRSGHSPVQDRTRPAARLRPRPRKPLLEDFSLSPWRYRRAKLLTEAVPPGTAAAAGGAAVMLAPSPVLGNFQYIAGYARLEVAPLLLAAVIGLLAGVIFTSIVYLSLYYLMHRLLSLDTRNSSLYDAALARYESGLVSWRLSAEFAR